MANARTLDGGCRCGNLGYRVSYEPGPVINCHCSFCRRVHGAAFTTVAFVPEESIVWTRGEDEVSVYVTPMGNRRHFCRFCASPLFNVGAAGELVAIVIGSLPDDAQPAPWAHVNIESKASWHPIADGLPAFESWPYEDELRALAAHNGCTRLPSQLLLPRS